MTFSSMKSITLKSLWLVIFIGNVCVFSSQAQDKKSKPVYFDTCEMTVMNLAQAMNDFAENGKPDSYLVIIGGAMKGERPSYNSRRIQEAIGYIDHWSKLRERIIYGIGPAEAQNGYLRFYVNGVLVSEIITRKNFKLCWGEGNEMTFTRQKK